MLRAGDAVDDFVWTRSDGTAVRLSDFGDRPLVLIFLRHLA
jgi:peroxiredoxin